LDEFDWVTDRIVGDDVGAQVDVQRPDVYFVLGYDGGACREEHVPELAHGMQVGQIR
jgi:hypothetical protein